MYINAFLWLFATITAIFSAWRIVKRFDPETSAFTVVHVIVIVWAWILIAAVALSLAHLLTGPTLVCAVTIIALTTLLSSAFAVRARSSDGSNNLVQREKPFGTAPRWQAMFWLLLISFWVGHVVSGGLLRFPTDWDSLMYHIPLIDYWLQAHSLYAPASGHWSVPGNNEVLGLWAVSLLPNDCLVALGNFPSALLLAFSALELGKRIGLSSPMRHLAVFCMVSNNVIMKQLIDAENDVAVAGLFLTVLCYGLRISRSKSILDCTLGAVALGLLSGIKHYALGYAFVAWLSISFLTGVRRGTATGIKTAVSWAVGAMIVGGYWYLRNFVVSGSPFHPLVKSRGEAYFNMGYPKPWQSTFFGNGSPEIWSLAEKAIWNMTGPCQLLAVKLLPIVFLWLIVSSIRSLRRGGAASVGLDRLVLAALMAGTTSVLAVTPMALEDVPGTLNQLRWGYAPVRYGLIPLYLAFVGFIVFATELIDVITTPTKAPAPFLARLFAMRSETWRYWPLKLMVLGLAMFQLAKVRIYNDFSVDWTISLLICFNLSAAVVAFAYLWRTTIRVRWFVVISAAIVSGITMGIHQLAQQWNEEFNDFYQYKVYFTSSLNAIRSLDPARDRIAYYDYRCYPFFGPQRQYRLFQQRMIRSMSDFRHYLINNKITLLVICSGETPMSWDNYPAVASYVVDRDKLFTLLYSDSVYSLYKVEQERLVAMVDE